MKKYSIDLMELSFEVKENMSEGDYLWVTGYCQSHYEGTSHYLDNKIYIEERRSKTKETLESQINDCLKLIEYIEELSKLFLKSAAIVEAGVENQKGSEKIRFSEPDD